MPRAVRGRLCGCERVGALRWWPLTFAGTASVGPLAFGVVYVFGVVLLGGLSTLGVTQGAEAAAALVFMLPAARSTR